MTELVERTNNYITPSRSFFQIKHFVVGQHDTKEMQYRQIIIEVKSLLNNIKVAEINQHILTEKIDRLESSGDKIDRLKAQKKRLGLVVLSDALAAAKIELNYFVELAKDYRHYTPDDIEANQEDYWDLRLTRQATTDRMALEQGVNVGNLASMMQAGLLQKAVTS